jgi:hypothetical protein
MRRIIADGDEIDVHKYLCAKGAFESPAPFSDERADILALSAMCAVQWCLKKQNARIVTDPSILRDDLSPAPICFLFSTPTLLRYGGAEASLNRGQYLAFQ